MYSFMINYKFIKFMNAPVSGQFGFQRPATFNMQSISEMHALSMFYCTIVFCCIAGFLFEACYLFDESSNSYPTKSVKDNWIIEWAFITVPYIMMFSLMLPSWALIYAQAETHDCDSTMKAIGGQWYWKYEVHNYPFWTELGYDWSLFWDCLMEGSKLKTDVLTMLEMNNMSKKYTSFSYGFLWYTLRKKTSNYLLMALFKKHNVFSGKGGYWSYMQEKFDSTTVLTEDLKPGHLSLLEVTQAVVLPMHSWVRINITGFDVVHSWAVPSFGTKVDGMPGSLNTNYLFIMYEGLFYGQCSEFCGANHYSMSIAVSGTF